MLHQAIDNLGRVCAPANRLRVLADETKPIFDFGPLYGYVERQENDTVLESAGLHLAKGNLYYGLHLRQLNTHEVMGSSIMPALKATANKAKEISEAGRETGFDLEELLQYMVGVTYLKLAQVAGRLLNFTCVELDERIFYTWRNAFVGWSAYAQRVAEVYKLTDRGALGQPLTGYGLIYQSVEEFIDNQAKKADIDLGKLA